MKSMIIGTLEKKGKVQQPNGVSKSVTVKPLNILQSASPAPIEMKNTMTDTANFKGDYSILSNSANTSTSSLISPIYPQIVSPMQQTSIPTPAPINPTNRALYPSPAITQAGTVPAPSKVVSGSDRFTFPSTPEDVVAMAAAPPTTSFSFGRPFHVDPSRMRPDRAAKVSAAASGTKDSVGDLLGAMLPDLADLASPRRRASEGGFLSGGGASNLSSDGSFSCPLNSPPHPLRFVKIGQDSVGSLHMGNLRA
jgi:hypothetical protein